MNQDEKLCTIEEMAAKTFRSHWSLRRMCREGVVRHFRIGRRLMFPESEVIRILRESEVKARAA